MTYYIVDADGSPKVEDDWWAWAEWHATGSNRVGDSHSGLTRVSTVLLGVDNALWGMMVIGGPLDWEYESYTSVETARQGHDRMVQRVRGVNG